MYIEPNVNQVITEALTPYKDLNLQTWSDLEYLGKNNIERLLKCHKTKYKSLKKYLKEIDTYIQLLDGKSKEEVYKTVNDFTTPRISKKKLKKEKEAVNEKCPYRGEDYLTYNYLNGEDEYLGGCLFLIRGGKKYETKSLDPEACSLKQLSEEEIAELVDIYKSIKSDIQDKMNLTDSIISKMVEIESNAEDKPYLPGLRRWKHFNVNDKVIFHVSDDKLDTSERGFIKAKVIWGYKHHDGCVNIVAENRFHNGKNEDGRGATGDVSDSIFMLKEEYEYLRSNPDFAKIWLNSVKSENFKPKYSQKCEEDLLSEEKPIFII